jgi:hypothetical protein
MGSSHTKHQSSRDRRADSNATKTKTIGKAKDISSPVTESNVLCMQGLELAIVFIEHLQALMTGKWKTFTTSKLNSEGIME